MAASQARPSRRPFGVLSALAVVGVGTFDGLLILLHPLQPDMDPTARFVSEYAAGHTGYLMTSAFAALAVGVLALAAGLRRALPAGGPAAAGVAALTAAAGLVIVMAVFRADVLVPAHAPTLRGEVHDAAAVAAFVAHIIAISLCSWAFRRAPEWRNYWRTSAALSVATAVAFAGLVIAFGAHLTGVGAWQRVFVGLGSAWLIAAGLALQRRSSAGPRERLRTRPAGR